MYDDDSHTIQPMSPAVHIRGSKLLPGTSQLASRCQPTPTAPRYTSDLRARGV